jgi:hypothetical protein
MSLWQGQGIQVDDEWVIGINFIEQCLAIDGSYFQSVRQETGPRQARDKDVGSMMRVKFRQRWENCINGFATGINSSSINCKMVQLNLLLSCYLNT